ncbi:MAG: hypothetical protein ACT452_17100 [Microthrixaceae bacterium]
MSPQRPSKQKRAAQNRNERAARAARAANANATPTAHRPSATASGNRSLLSRLRGGQPRSRTSAPRTSSASTRSVPVQPPGYRAAMSAVLAAVAALVLCTVALRYPVDVRGDVYSGPTLVADWSISALRVVADEPDATAAEVVKGIDDWTPGRSKDTVAKALWPFSLSLLLPVVGAGLGFHAVRRRASSKVVNRALYATLFGAVLTQGLLMLFLPVVLAMGVAMFQVRKAETIAAVSAPTTTGDDVIEVDSVEDAAAGEPVDDAAH